MSTFCYLWDILFEFVKQLSLFSTFIQFQIVPGGIASKCGKLRMGDRILKVNDTDVSRATHQEAVMELLKPGNDIKLTIQHDPLPAGFQVCIFILFLFCFFLSVFVSVMGFLHGFVNFPVQRDVICCFFFVAKLDLCFKSIEPWKVCFLYFIYY